MSNNQKSSSTTTWVLIALTALGWFLNNRKKDDDPTPGPTPTDVAGQVEQAMTASLIVGRDGYNKIADDVESGAIGDAVKLSEAIGKSGAAMDVARQGEWVAAARGWLPTEGDLSADDKAKVAAWAREVAKGLDNAR